MVRLKEVNSSMPTTSTGNASPSKTTSSRRKRVVTKDTLEQDDHPKPDITAAPSKPERLEPPEFVNYEDMKAQSAMRLWHVAYYAVVFVIIGVPIWLNTTGSYRASLPMQRIIEHNSRSLRIVVPVHLLVTDDKRLAIGEHVMQLLHRDLPSIKLYKIDIQLDYDFAVLDDDTSKKVLHWNNDGRPLDRLNMNDDVEQMGRLDVSFVLLSGDGKAEVIWSDGAMVFVVADDAIDFAQLIVQSLVDVYIDVPQLRILSQRIDERTVESAGRSAGDSEVHRVWSTVPPARVVLDTYLLLPDIEYATACDEQLKNLTQLVQLSVSSVAKSVGLLTDLVSTSQRLYDVPMPSSKVRRNDQHQRYEIQAASLPLLVNPLERYVSTIEQTAPVYRVLLYVTPSWHHPLHIVDHVGDTNKLNSFVVADWGAVSIVNSPLDESSVVDSGGGSLSCASATESLLRSVQLYCRHLLGVESLIWPAAHRRFNSHKPISLWEWRRSAVRQLTQNTLMATHTLASLEQLLANITTIIIQDQIAGEVNAAVDALDVTFEAAGRVDQFAVSLRHSQVAMARADAAFFDESLLALLYFPADQKYAIYVPLFLPVSIPIVLSVFWVVRAAITQRRQNAKLKSD